MNTITIKLRHFVIALFAIGALALGGVYVNQAAADNTSAPRITTHLQTADTDPSPVTYMSDGHEDEYGDEYDEEDWDEAEDVYYETIADLLGLDIDTLFDKLDAGQSVAEIAQEQGVDVQTIIDSLVAEENSWIDELEAEGELSAEEADEFRAEAEAYITFEVNFGYTSPDMIAAEVIGVDADTLWDALDNDQTVADVATANGVDPQAVIDALVAAQTAEVDALLNAGLIDAEEADEWKAEIPAEADEMVNNTIEFFEAEFEHDCEGWDEEWEDGEWDEDEYGEGYEKENDQDV